VSLGKKKAGHVGPAWSLERRVRGGSTFFQGQPAFREVPPGPNYGPFGYFRLALLIFAAVVAALLIFTFW
jgi:hypothetical protein